MQQAVYDNAWKLRLLRRLLAPSGTHGLSLGPHPTARSFHTRDFQPPHLPQDAYLHQNPCNSTSSNPASLLAPAVLVAAAAALLSTPLALNRPPPTSLSTLPSQTILSSQPPPSAATNLTTTCGHNPILPPPTSLFRLANQEPTTPLHAPLPNTNTQNTALPRTTTPTPAASSLSAAAAAAAAAPKPHSAITGAPSTSQSKPTAPSDFHPPPSSLRPQSRTGALIEGSSYSVYDAEGRPSSFDVLLAFLQQYDVVLLGEYHDDPVAHGLQLRVLEHVLGAGGGGQGQGERVGGGMEGDGAAGGDGVAGGQQGEHQQRGGEGYVGGRRVALSLEMFERDVQGVMDEYLAGAVTEADLMRDARPWPNYASDYRPLVLAARRAGAPVVCANAPRRYVSLVGRSGASALASLPPAAQQHLPPLPLRPASALYTEKMRWTMQRARQGPQDGEGGTEETAAPLLRDQAATRGQGGSESRGGQDRGSGAGSGGGDGGSGGSSQGGETPASGSPSSGGASGGRDSGSSSGGCPYIGMTVRSNFVDAQNLWDATMAVSIAGALQRLGAGVEGGGGGGGGALVVHVCGKFHSEQRLGICEHLSALAPTARVAVVTFVPSGRGVEVPTAILTAARLHTYGDWLVLTDATLPRSFDSEHPV